MTRKHLKTIAIIYLVFMAIAFIGLIIVFSTNVLDDEKFSTFALSLTVVFILAGFLIGQAEKKIKS